MVEARRLAWLLFAVVFAWTSPVSAQNYPTHPITLVVPFPAGGATDAIARILIDPMSQQLGQQIVIENVGGAGGLIGAGRVARAAPDGYTLLLHQVGLAAGVTLYPNASFDAAKDLTGIGMVNTSASVVAGHKSLPPNTFKELVAWMKDGNHVAKFAHAGVGAFGHLCGVMFVQEIGAKADQIPYRGGGPALNDLVAGHADLSCLSAAVTEQGAATQEIARSVDIAAKRTADTAEEVSRVNDATENTRNSVTAVRAVADDLGGIAHRIRDQVEEFTLQLRAG